MKKFKICGRCKRKLPNTKEYFHANNQSVDKLHYYCKKCRSKERTEWGRKNPDKVFKYWLNRRWKERKELIGRNSSDTQKEL